MFLASSVFFAIYDAVSAARTEEGLTGHFRFDSPATAEKIRMACVDKFTKQVFFLKKSLSLIQILQFFTCNLSHLQFFSQFPEAEPGTYKPWFVYL